MGYLSSLGKPARFRLFAGVGLILVLTAALLWWALSPRQQLLFGNLREGDAAEIVQSLDAWKVPHTIVDGGTSIMVPVDLVYETRMRLVSAGIPKGGHVGFELFDNSDFGVTEFAQRVNYQRALQGEIERTISSLPGVESARIHLTIRRPGLFVGEHESSKASVALTLKPGEVLSRQQVNGIRSLVAAAVEGLSTNDVSVLNSNGALLAAANGDSGLNLDDHSEEKTRVENQIRAKVSQLLGQVLHDGDFRIAVEASLNFDSVREVNERPLEEGVDGNGLVLRKHLNSSDPGDGTSKSQSQEETDFLHGTEHQEITRAPGRIERLSIAVVLPANVDEFDVPRIQSLISAAAGIDTSRGDRLEVSRLGRGTVLESMSPLSHVPPVATVAAVVPVLDGEPSVSHKQILGSWPKMLPLLAGLVLIFAIFIIAMPSRPRTLKADERDAVLAKLRGWLADGSEHS